MTELIAIPSERPEDAEEARRALFEMDRAHIADVADAVVASVNEKGDIKLDQMVNLWSAGPAGRSFLSLLSSLLFLHPLRGVLPGATADVLFWALGDYGVGGRFMAELSEALKPGQGVLFVLARMNPPAAILERLGPAGLSAIRAEVDHGQEQKLRDAFAKAHADALRHEAGATVDRAADDGQPARVLRPTGPVGL